jgi:hypothetical protein
VASAAVAVVATRVAVATKVVAAVATAEIAVVEVVTKAVAATKVAAAATGNQPTHSFFTQHPVSSEAGCFFIHAMR